MEEVNKPKEDHSSDLNQEINSNKRIYITIGVLLVLLVCVGTYFLISSRSSSTATIPITANKDSIAKTDSLKNGAMVGEGEEESPYSENVVIANGLNVGDKALKFGDKVYLDDSRSNTTTAYFYLENPMSNQNAKVYQGDATLFIAEYRFEDYRKNFALPPFSSLPSGVKKILLEDNYSDGDQFLITQNTERAKSSVCFGDFDGDGHMDVAALQDNNNKQICRLLVICSNSVTKLPYTAYTEKFSDKLQIKSIKKGSSIYLSSSDLVSSPIDGVLITGEETESVLLYDKKLQKFKTYYQAPTTQEPNTEE